MPQLKRLQIRVIEEAVAYPKGLGYVLNFSDRTISEYFEGEFSVDIDDTNIRSMGHLSETV